MIDYLYNLLNNYYTTYFYGVWIASTIVILLNDAWKSGKKPTNASFSKMLCEIVFGILYGGICAVITPVAAMLVPFQIVYFATYFIATKLTKQ